MPDLSFTEESIAAMIPEDLPPLDGKLSRAARVLLAMDVLARLTAEKPDVRLRMESTYFACARPEKLNPGPFDSSKIPTKTCQVCARGALFLASVDRYNECELYAEDLRRARRHGFGSDPVADLVVLRSTEDFGVDQTYFIEDAFEGERHGVSGKAAMIAICANLIANHGEFIPKQHETFLAITRRGGKAAREPQTETHNATD